MYKNVQTNPEKIPKLNTTLMLFYVDTTNFLKAIRGNGYRPVPKGGTFPNETIMLVVRSSGLWEAYTQTCPQMGENFYHDMLMPLHDTMPSFMNFRRVLDLLEFKNQASKCFVGNQRCSGVWNSFSFLAWDLSMHPRTHIWFFNQFICIGVCACSSNLNCSPEMARKPI